MLSRLNIKASITLIFISIFLFSCGPVEFDSSSITFPKISEGCESQGVESVVRTESGLAMTNCSHGGYIVHFGYNYIHVHGKELNMTDLPLRFAHIYNRAMIEIDRKLELKDKINEDEVEVFMFPQMWPDSSCGDESVEVYLPTFTKCVCTAFKYENVGLVFMNKNLTFSLDLNNKEEEKFFMESLQYGGFEPN